VAVETLPETVDVTIAVAEPELAEPEAETAAKNHISISSVQVEEDFRSDEP
jgi:hypothetical protein